VLRTLEPLALSIRRRHGGFLLSPPKGRLPLSSSSFDFAQQPLVLGNFGRLVGGPWCLSGQHGVGEDEELSRASDKGEFVGFASDFQAAIQCDQG
jgi:hypothetical protein